MGPHGGLGVLPEEVRAGSLAVVSGHDGGAARTARQFTPGPLRRATAVVGGQRGIS